MMNKYLISVFFALIGASLTAQDIHFSQFYMSPLNLNPAMTGVMNGSNRFTLNYRNQWSPVLQSAAYNTYSLSYDQRNVVGSTDFFGYGGAIWNDVAGESRYGSTQIKGAGSYSKKVGGGRKQGHYLSVGAELGMTQRRVRSGDLRWLTQVDLQTAEYCPGCGSPENLDDNNFMYLDVSGGVMWFSQLDDRTSFFVGGAMHHLNRPNVSFLNTNDPLHRRITAHAGGEAPINNTLSIRPNVIYMAQGPHREVNAGTSVRMKIRSGEGFYGTRNYFLETGLWYRAGTAVNSSIHSDAVIFTARVDYDRYSVGMSYDYTISGLSQNSPGNGSFELSLTYLMDNKLMRAPQCPVF